MAKQNKREKKYKFNSYILINKTKRAGFMFVFAAMFILMVAVISELILSGSRSWATILIPMCLLGVPVVLYPPIEQWVYNPWQAKAQKYERHYKD